MPYKNREDHLKACAENYQNKKQEYKDRSKKRREEKPEKVALKKREWYLQNTFNITIDDYNNMFNAQNGCCDICKQHQSNFTKRLFVDHCHTTGKVRGLLCSNCNSLLGHAKDNLDFLENAKQYLIKNKEN